MFGITKDILVSHRCNQSAKALAYKGFVHRNLLILLSVRQAATVFETKLFLPSQKQAGGWQKRDGDVDIRALLYSITRWIQTCGLAGYYRKKTTNRGPVVGKNSQVQIIWHSKKKSLPNTGEVICLLIREKQEAGMKWKTGVTSPRGGKVNGDKDRLW